MCSLSASLGLVVNGLLVQQKRAGLVDEGAADHTPMEQHESQVISLEIAMLKMHKRTVIDVLRKLGHLEA